MSVFTRDDSWQKSIREKVLKPFYQKHSHERRFVFTDKGRLADILQKQLAVDTVVQKDGNEIVAVEEKIVRWPDNPKKYPNGYTAFTLETWSCTVEGHERQGWMYTAKCDFLLYCFTQQDESVIAYSIPFPKLQTWFFENNNFESYRITRTDQINRTECRIVPIRDVMKGVPETKRFTLQPEDFLSEPELPEYERQAAEVAKDNRWMR